MKEKRKERRLYPLIFWFYGAGKDETWDRSNAHKEVGSDGTRGFSFLGLGGVRGVWVPFRQRESCLPSAKTHHSLKFLFLGSKRGKFRASRPATDSFLLWSDNRFFWREKDKQRMSNPWWQRLCRYKNEVNVLSSLKLVLPLLDAFSTSFLTVEIVFGPF